MNQVSRVENNRRFDIVFFDLGSTLLYFDSDWSQVLLTSYRAMLDSLELSGLTMDDDLFLATIHERLAEYRIERNIGFVENTTESVLRDVLVELGCPSVPAPVVRRALDAMYAVSQRHWKLEEDALPTLKTLHLAGYRMGLISNAGDAKDVLTLVDRHRLRPYLEHIFISAEVGVRKPHPRIFHLALEAFHARPDQAVMVGDLLESDILGAYNSGIASVWINRRAKQPQNNPITPDAVVPTLMDLPRALSEWK